MKDRIKILVCAHKDDFVLNDNLFEPIQVGKDLTDLNLGFIKDNTGENISNKNLSFCELTALYWAWKNQKEVDYIGLAHYRRYFDLDYKGIQPIYKMPMADFIDRAKGFSKSRYLDILASYDIIAQRPMVSPNSLALDYCFYHISEDLRTLEAVVHDLCPDYDNSFKKVIYRGNKQRGFNMFVTSWTLFQEYAKWLFDILFEVERRVDISSYSPAQKRIFGYMSERLLSVYIEKNHLRVYDAPVLLINENTSDEVSDLYYRIRKAKANLAFKLSMGRK